MAIPLNKSSVKDDEISVVIIPRIMSQEELRACNWYDKDDPSMVDCGAIRILNSYNCRWCDLPEVVTPISLIQIVTRIEYIAWHKKA